MVLGLVLTQDLCPMCSEMRPGSVTGVTALEAVAQRLRHRFGIRSVCLVADRGMISKRTMAAIEARGWQYILGTRPHSTKEVREEVLTDPGAMTTIKVARVHDPEPLTLEIKEVVLPGPVKTGKSRRSSAFTSSVATRPRRAVTQPAGWRWLRTWRRSSNRGPKR